MLKNSETPQPLPAKGGVGGNLFYMIFEIPTIENQRNDISHNSFSIRTLHTIFCSLGLRYPPPRSVHRLIYGLNDPFLSPRISS